MNHLIANTGIQFITTEIEINPSEPLQIGSKMLKYAFCEVPDFLDDTTIVFDLLYYHPVAGVHIPVKELLDSETNPGALLTLASGREEIDAMGMVKMASNCPITNFSQYADGEEGIYTINSLESMRVRNPENEQEIITAYKLLLNHWLPMPMFFKEADGITAEYPLGWCRMKMTDMGPGVQKGTRRFRLVWAFDTTTSDDPLAMLRPGFDLDEKAAEFTLCNRADQLLWFMSSGDDFHAFADYVASLLGLDITRNTSRKYKAYYIYLLNLIRLSGGAPDITLHSGVAREIPVDMVLDIGNSRTCGILCEDGQFTKGTMLALRDLSMPDITYRNKTFDMRIVFRRPDLGNDIVLDEDMFRWHSFVRIGEEARRLVYHSMEEEGLSEKTTNYSSPKRYLWDHKPFAGEWENLVTSDDPFSMVFDCSISEPILSKLFDENGHYTGQLSEKATILGEESHHYSRSSLMTFAMIEILQQAISQINSVEYRDKWGDKDCRRYLRDIIVTCPTAMPVSEQKTLRQCMADAFDTLTKCIPDIKPANIRPDADTAEWSYDEATSCQLTYLYAEIAQRYSGEVHKFFDYKGHVRNDLFEDHGYEKKSLTIGTIDIGAGTTDVMICAYEYHGTGDAKITPVPLFWDSFYLAGDDILRNIVQNVVIEGSERDDANLGNIRSALRLRIAGMTDEELRAIPRVADESVYANKVRQITGCFDPKEKENLKMEFASALLKDFFGSDSSMMGYKDRRSRTDFNTQISVPIAQLMMEQLRLHRPSRLLSFDDIFAEIKPSKHLLDYFAYHFGFRFEELSWRFDPDEIAAIVKTTMEPLMRQLAMVFYAKQCDIVVLAGRPTSLDAITEIFIKYMPVSPDRLVRLNDYHVGSWFPTADGNGYFYDQKSIVAVGALVGYLAAENKIPGLVLDFSMLKKKMKSTANHIGIYNSKRRNVEVAPLTTGSSMATFDISVFPAFLGCRQLTSSAYQARPLAAIYNFSGRTPLKIMVSRDYDNPESLKIEEAIDSQGNTIAMSKIELLPQTLVDDGKYWLDKGEFDKLK